MVRAGVHQRHAEVSVQDAYGAREGDVKVNSDLIVSRREINYIVEQLKHTMPREITFGEINPIVYNVNRKRERGKTVSSSGDATRTLLQPRS